MMAGEEYKVKDDYLFIIYFYKRECCVSTGHSRLRIQKEN